MNYSWEPGFEHDWLSVDRFGRLGYFMSAYDSLLPSSIAIPWQYLHNLPYMLISYNENLPCSKIKGMNLSYEEIVRRLSSAGLSVWDATVDAGTLGFQKVASSNKELIVDALPIFFRNIANNFYVERESFESAHVLRGDLFHNRENLRYHHHCVGCDQRTISIEEDIFDRVLGARNFKAMISIADRCMIEGIPDIIGPSFSCWNMVRCYYIYIVKKLALLLKCDKICTCDFMGVRRLLNVSDFESILVKMPIPFFAISMQRHDGGRVSILLPKHNVVGCKFCNYSTGFLNYYENNVHIEDWDFELRVETNESNKISRSKIATMIMRLPFVGPLLGESEHKFRMYQV